MSPADSLRGYCLCSLTNLEADGDAPRTIAEWTFFNANPHLGKFIFWCACRLLSFISAAHAAHCSPLTKRVDVRALPRETHGTKDNASDPLVPASLKQYMIENFKVWQGDQLVTRMEELRSMLYTNRASTAIVSCVCAHARLHQGWFLTVCEWRSYPAGRAVRTLRLRL